MAVLLPFVPRNFFIDQIPDPELRAALSASVDAFCSGEDVEPPAARTDPLAELGEPSVRLVVPISFKLNDRGGL